MGEGGFSDLGQFLNFEIIRGNNYFYFFKSIISYGETPMQVSHSSLLPGINPSFTRVCTSWSSKEPHITTKKISPNHQHLDNHVTINSPPSILLKSCHPFPVNDH